MLFLGDDDHRIRAKLPTYFAAQLLTHDWLLANGVHELHAVRGTSKALPAFAVRRPDGTWAVLIMNKNARRTLRVRLSGTVRAVQYSRREYAWHAAGDRGAPVRDLPPRRFVAGDELTLPPYSLTVALVAAP
jgi:hypothetical protein